MHIYSPPKYDLTYISHLLDGNVPDYCDYIYPSPPPPTHTPTHMHIYPHSCIFISINYQPALTTNPPLSTTLSTPPLSSMNECAGEIKEAWQECEQLRKAVLKNNGMKRNIAKRLKLNEKVTPLGLSYYITPPFGFYYNISPLTLHYHINPSLCTLLHQTGNYLLTPPPPPPSSLTSPTLSSLSLPNYFSLLNHTSLPSPFLSMSRRRRNFGKS